MVGEEFGEVSTYAQPVLLCFSWDPIPLTHGDRAEGICGSDLSPVHLPKFSVASERLDFLEHTGIN